MLLSHGAISWSRARKSMRLGTLVFLAGGVLSVALWWRTNNVRWIELYFRFPGALFLVLFAGAGLWLSARAARLFSPGETLRTAWSLITASAALNFIGDCAVQLFGTHSLFRELGWVTGINQKFDQWGLLFGGPCRLALMCAAVFLVLRAYRRAGFLGRLRFWDWFVLAGLMVYLVMETTGVVKAYQAGKRAELFEILHFPTSPILWVLLAQTLRLYRSASSMGSGWVSLCWKSLSDGVFLVGLGNVLIMAGVYGYIQWPWTSVEWCVWVPAAAAIAIAPTYQIEAIEHALANQPADGPAK